MIDGIGSSTSYLSSLFATNGSSASGSTTGSASSLAQTEEKLFAAIDSNGDGSISQSEFSSFLGQASGASGSSQTQATPSPARYGTRSASPRKSPTPSRLFRARLQQPC